MPDITIKHLLEAIEDNQKNKKKHLEDMEIQKQKLSKYKPFFTEHPKFFISVIFALNQQYQFIPELVFYQIANKSVDNQYDLINKGRSYLQMGDTNPTYKEIIQEIIKYLKIVILIHINDFNDVILTATEFSL